MNQQIESLRTSLLRGVASLVRRPRCRGFGVQSPFAYSFIREVIRGAEPARSGAEAAAYRQLAVAFPESGVEQRLHRFMLRLARWKKAEVWAGNHLSAADIVYISSGHQPARCRVWDEGATVVVIDLSVAAKDYRAYYERVMRHAGRSLVVVLTHVRCSAGALAFCREVEGRGRHVVVFDFFDGAVFFYDPTKMKGRYLVMLGS